MISLEDLHTLCEEPTRDLIDLNIEREHTAVALDKSLCHRVLVAGQVKYLQRARAKLPSYYAARCIIPDIAFEQSSSEATAEAKMMEGESVLELCCGLGVDAFVLSKRFRRVVTLERNEILAAVARENFRRLGCDNIEVITGSAEGYLERCEERFDAIYADPDRRDAQGKKCVVLQSCSPNILSLMDHIRRVSDMLVVKCSPLFDVDEAFRLFPGSRVEVVSLGGECKEVVIYDSRGDVERIGATAIGDGSVWYDRGEVDYCVKEFGGEYKYVYISDVALQKSRLARRFMSGVCDIWSDNGYGFSVGCEDISLARRYEIESIMEYQPKVLRRYLSERGIKGCEILKREFPYSVERLTQQLKIKEGGVKRLLFTTVLNRQIVVILKDGIGNSHR